MANGLHIAHANVYQAHKICATRNAHNKYT